MQIQHYKAIWFDAADTLLLSPDATIAIKEFLQMRGITCETGAIEPVVRQVLDEHYYNKKHAYAAICTPESDRDFWVALYSDLFSRLGLEAGKPIWAQELYEQFTSSAMYSLFEDVLRTVGRLRKLGLQIGILSNFAPTLQTIFETLQMDLKDVAPFIVSTVVGVEKPDPTIYLMALKQSGLQPNEVLFVGDHLVNDVEAPNLVGIDAVRIKRFAHQPGEGITELDQLFEEAIPFLKKGSRV
jgi:putative hydrolase of the HAD superfamily